MKTVHYERETPYQGIGIDRNLKSAYGAYAACTWGMSATPGVYHVFCHLDDSDGEEDAELISVGNDTLTVVTDKATIDADDSDIATISLVTTDAQIDYEVFNSYYVVEFSGTLTASGGSVNYEFKTGVPDIYLIRFKRQTGFEDGFVEVEAS